MADLDRACPHPNFDVALVVKRFEATGKYVAEIRIRCAHCDEPFVFLGDLPVGVNLSGVATSLDRHELRAGIYPEIEDELREQDR